MNLILSVRMGLVALSLSVWSPYRLVVAKVHFWVSHIDKYTPSDIFI